MSLARPSVQVLLQLLSSLYSQYLLMKSVPDHVLRLLKSVPDHVLQLLKSVPDHMLELLKSLPDHMLELLKSVPDHMLELLPLCRIYLLRHLHRAVRDALSATTLATNININE